MGSRRGYRGHVPEDGELVCELGDGWELYRRTGKGDGGWQSLKLVSRRRRRPAANYWLGWNGARFADGREFRRLERNEPALVEQMEAAMSALVVAADGW